MNSPEEAARLLKLQHIFTVMTIISVVMAVLISIAGITKLLRGISARIEANKPAGTVVPIISTENSFTTQASLNTSLIIRRPMQCSDLSKRSP